MEAISVFLSLLLLGICVFSIEILFTQGWEIYIKEVQFPAFLHFLQWLPRNFKKVVGSLRKIQVLPG